LIQFTAKRDSILQKHLTLAIKNSEKRKLSLKNKSKGRDSLVTLLSKTTINKIIIAIIQSIRNKIKKNCVIKNSASKLTALNVYDTMLVYLIKLLFIYAIYTMEKLLKDFLLF